MENSCHSSVCPLCWSSEIALFFRDNQREYYRCAECQLVFVPPSYHLSSEQEKKEYDLHENSVDDPHYRAFLNRLQEPLLAKLGTAPLSGLDYGCGPAPALANMLEQSGHSMSLFDPFYVPDKSVLNQKYDFICSSEVVEHMRNPAEEFRKLFDLLYDGGILAVMTKLRFDEMVFEHWHYIRDRTHICFYHPETFTYIAHHYSAERELFGKDVVLLQKKQIL